MNEEIKKIRDYIKCPQFGDNHYGKWGVLNLEQRKAFLKLCDYIESSDNYITSLQEENQKLNKIYEELEKRIKKCSKYLYLIDSHEFISDIPIAILNGNEQNLSYISKETLSDVLKGDE